MQPSITRSADPAIRAALRARARGAPAVSYEEFMDIALYEPSAGYYRRGGRRIGYGPGTDFLTATASAPTFGRLVVAACVRLLGPAAAGAEFVEIGAEPESDALAGVPHPFASVRQIRAGEPLRLAGPTVVFSNELFDAQPFRRFRFRAGSWRELGVAVGAAELAEVELE